MRKLRLPKPKTIISFQTCQCKSHLKVYILLLTFTALLFTSCSPQKRLERLIKRYPELLIADTVKYNALVPIPAKTAQFEINYTCKDTLISLYSEDSIKLTYAIINDSIIKLFVYVPPDTISVPIEVPVEKIKYTIPDNWGLFIEKIPYVALAFIALVIYGLFFRKK